MGKLYLVSTPIGNLKDISQQALDTLKSVDVIACEDTRHTGILLAHYQIKNNLISYHDYNEQQRIPEIIDKLISGQNIALVSDAGTPIVSDPGYKLVRECIKQEIPITTIPGPSSPIAALILSGLPPDKFIFMGYLPKTQGKKSKSLDYIKAVKGISSITVIFFEAPHRILKTLDAIYQKFGDVEVCICQELTKMHEEVRREHISQSIQHYSKQNPKGEFVILF